MPFATAPNHEDDDGEMAFWPYLRDRRRSPVRGRSRAPPASSTASAVSRKRTAAATSTTTREPRAHGPDPCRAGRAGIAADIPEVEVDDPDGAELLVLGGAARGAWRSRRSGKLANTACRSRARISCTSTRSHGTSLRCSARSSASSSPR